MSTPAETTVPMLSAAQLITASADRGQALRFNAQLVLDQPAEQVRHATLRASSHGVFEAQLNGQPVDDSVLNPGWTSYQWRLQVIETDVTTLVAESADEVEVALIVGNGWWRGSLGWDEVDLNYGQEIGVIAELEISYLDGSVQQLVTSPQWRASTTDTVQNTIYNGQTIDARLRHQPPVEVQVRADDSFDHSRLVARSSPLIRRQQVLPIAEVLTTPSGKTVLDFGQNLVGWLRVRMQAPAGTEVVFRHAEVLDSGELGTAPLRSAKATDTFICSGQADSFEPTFTFHGFRYVEVTGWPTPMAQAVTAGDIEAVVVHSDLDRVGWFSCSEPLVNQLVHNSLWGQRGNFLSLPTDCPQRDERLGWTGDIAAYAATAAAQFEVSDFLHSWLLDLAAELDHGGVVPWVVPDVLAWTHAEGYQPQPTAIWSDAAAWVPQALWWATGDLGRLRAHYRAMVGHVDSVEKVLTADGLWDAEFQFGDWLDPDAPAEDPAAAKADKAVVATAAFYRTARFAAEAAQVLGMVDDADRFRALADRVRAAFTQHYVTDQGRVKSDCATVYALALHFGLLLPQVRAAAVERLVELVVAANYRVSTGFAGTPFITWALSEHGHADVAYRLLLERECPSWLYPISQGATTIWERWDSMLPDGTLNDGGMTSFNHYALGAVCDWLYQVVGGIRPAAPGFAEVLVAPVPGPGLDWAKAERITPHGTVACSWIRRDDAVEVTVTVPDGVPATLRRPDGTTQQLPAGTSQWLWDVG